MDSRSQRHGCERLDRIRRLAPLVSQHRDALDRERRLPEPLFDALAGADLFRLWVPREMGGPGCSPLDFLRIVEEVSMLDGSLGWLVGNGAGMSRAAGYLPPEVARRWFAEPRAFVASATGAIGTATEVEGGYRVSGRWPFASGIHHASHVMALCNAAPEGADAPRVICCYLPRQDVEVIDRWHVSGLRGTGSCDFAVEGALVPVAHTHPFLAPEATQPGLLYRMPAVSVFAMTVVAVPIGIAAAALGHVVGLASHKAGDASAPLLRDREIVQSEVGRAQVILGAARALLVEAVVELEAATSLGGDRLIRARAGFRAACTHVAESTMRAVDGLAACAGASAIFESLPIERCIRDLQAAARHIAMSPKNLVIAGRLALGLEVGHLRF